MNWRLTGVNSVEFLKAFHPEGPWVLTAIQVDRKGIETKSFLPKESSQATKWIKKHNNKANLYFSVNLPAGKLTKKAVREDIALVGWLHVDIDAQVNEKLSEELIRIERVLTKDCPTLPPTVIIFSGGGYQAFWKLSEPVELHGDLTVAEDLALYNKQLEIILGGDNCHNIDRIMRLPGTMNLPNAKKVERGRVPVEATVYWFHRTKASTYLLDQFEQAPDVQTAGVRTSDVSIQTANIKRLSSVNELDEWHVDDRVKVIIVQGFNPDQTKEGDRSRSGWLFDVCCQLIRSEVPDEIIFSVITDPHFGISAHVLEAESNSDKYAIRQIQRAKEEVEEPWLRELNDRFMVIGNLGGRCRVCEEVMDNIQNRTSLTKQTFVDFKNRFCNHFITMGKKQVPVGQWWINNPRRREYDYLTFSPGGGDPKAYNLWQGYGCKSIPGEKHEPFLIHLLNNICAGNQQHYKYLLGWMARTVQRPNKPGETAVVLRGASGVGKSFFAKTFGSLWGRHFLQVSNAQHLVGIFNVHLRDCVVLFGDEAFFAGDRKHESVLKTLITEDRMVITPKGVDSEMSPNFTHLILASNASWVVPTGPTERRFFVLDVGDDHKQDHKYFRRIDKSMANGGRENLLHFLLNYNLVGFDVRKVPLTEALREQKVHSLDSRGQWWLKRLTDGTLTAGHDKWEPQVVCSELVDDYIETCAKFNVQRRGSEVKLGIFLNHICPGKHPIRGRETTGHSRRYFYVFPSLQSCRDRWDELSGSDFDWPLSAELKKLFEPGEKPG